MTGVMTDPSWLRSNSKYYAIVELVGKSRNFGIMRHLLNSSFADEHNAKAFHLINELKEFGFIQLEVSVTKNRFNKLLMNYICPHSVITTDSFGEWLGPIGTFSTFLITSIPSTTLPNTTCLPSKYSHLAQVIKN